MKSVSCTIWILGALLAIATLDRVPDPPAVNPSSGAFQIVQLHHCGCDAVTPRCDSLDVPHPFPASSMGTNLCEQHCPSGRMVLTVQAADPSPPAPRPRRKASFQS